MAVEGFRQIGSQSSPQSDSKDGPDRRIELITGRMRRRSWTDAEKAAIVAESLVAGAKVTAVARRHQVTRGLLWAWRQQILGGCDAKAGAHFVPLCLSTNPAGSRPTMMPDVVAVDPAPGASAGDPAGSIEIEAGRARVRVRGCVDLQALRHVLTMLDRAL